MVSETKLSKGNKNKTFLSNYSLVKKETWSKKKKKTFLRPNFFGTISWIFVNKNPGISFETCQCILFLFET
jgi:hypothetical protein